MDWSLPVHGIQAWILEWVAMPSFGQSSQPRDCPHVSCNWYKCDWYKERELPWKTVRIMFLTSAVVFQSKLLFSENQGMVVFRFFKRYCPRAHFSVQRQNVLNISRKIMNYNTGKKMKGWYTAAAQWQHQRMGLQAAPKTYNSTAVLKITLGRQKSNAHNSPS